MPVYGGPELKAKMDSLATVGPQLRLDWMQSAAQKMRSTAPSHTGRGRTSIRAGLSNNVGRFQGRAQAGPKAAVFGDYWLIFVDRGTKRHEIAPRHGQALKFEARGRTVFSKRVVVRGKRRRPFITRASQDALREVGGSAIQNAWSRKRQSGRFTFLR